MSPVRLDRCIVFDDDEYQLRERKRQVAEVLAHLHDHGKIEFVGGYEPPHLIASQQRVEVLETVYDDPHALVIADMKADAPGPDAGNLGARMIRAIAENPRTSERTRRIVWSRHNVSDVTKDMRHWAHAFVLYDVDSADDLADAIEYVLEDGREPREFPAARTPGRWSDQVRAAIGRLVVRPRPGDDLIALRLAAGVEPAQINAELARSAVLNRRPNVQAFITQTVADSNGTLATDDAHAEIRKIMAPLAVERVPDPIRPKDCDQALHIRNQLVQDFPNGRHLQVTWLTPGEDALLAEFLALYVLNTQGIRENDVKRRYQGIQ